MIRDPISVYIKLSRLTVELVEQQARQQRISRVAWLRNAILKQLQEDQNHEAQAALESRLLTRLDHVISAVNAHTTAEIDSLTRR